MLTDEEILTIFQQYDDETDAGAITVGRAIEQAAIAAHSAGAQEPVGTAVNDEELGRFWEMHKPASEFLVGTHVYTHPQPTTDAARDVLAKAVARYDELTGSIQGCADGGCLIRKPEGLHTNSGCRCARDHVKMQRAMYAAGELRKALAEIERLDGAPTAEGE